MRKKDVCFVIGCTEIEEDTTFAEALVKARICSSKSDARRLSKQHGLYVCFEGQLAHISEWIEITNVDALVGPISTFVLVSRGRKWTMNHLKALINKQRLVSYA